MASSACSVQRLPIGISLPREDRLLRALKKRLEPLSIVMLMPIFFASGGLGAMGLILAVAMVGKIVGGTAGAQVCG